MPTYKLTYFAIKGLAEPIRFMLSYGGIDFIDDRVESETWPTIKPTTPFGQVPVLEIDGKKINQCTAICRYLAKQYGIAGKDDWEALEIDSTVDTIHDIRLKIGVYHYENNAEVKARLLEAVKQFVPVAVTRLDAQVKNNGGYFVGGKLSWADLVFVALLDYVNFIHHSDIIESAENLKALRAKVLAIPQIKAWIAKRPPTEY